MTPDTVSPEPPQTRSAQALDLGVLEDLLFPVVLQFVERKVVPILFNFMLKVGAFIRKLDVEGLNARITEEVVRPAYEEWLEDTHDPRLRQLVEALRPAFLPD